MRCPHCGYNMPDGAVRCVKCGYSLRSRGSQKRSRAASRIGRFFRGLVVAVLALAVGVGGAFAYTWWTGPHPLDPAALLDERPAQIVGRVSDYAEADFEGMTVYFSSEEFRDAMVRANEDGLIESPDMQIPSKYVGEHYVAFMGSDGSVLTLEDLRDGVRPQGVGYVEVVRAQASNSGELVDVLRSRGEEPDHVLAVPGGGLGMDLMGEFATDNMVSALYYGEAGDGVCALVPTGPTSLFIEVAAESGTFSAQDILSHMASEDEAGDVVALLGAAPEDAYYE